MKNRKTIKAKVYRPTERKKKELDRLVEEWEEAKKILENDGDYQKVRDKTDLPSASISSMEHHGYQGTDQPLIINKQSIQVWKQDNELSDMFVEFYTGNTRLWLPTDMWEQHKELILDEDTEIRDSKLIKKDNEFYFHFTVERDVEIRSPEKVIGVDIGDKNLAVSVTLETDDSVKDVNFHGKEIRGLRRHYSWLKKRLQEKQAYQKLKEISGKEQRTVDDICHQVSKEIVEKAEKENAVIVTENLDGMSGDSGKGSRMNRIMNEMPHHKLRKYIEYKALWKGIPVVQSDPRWTSQTCHRCNQVGKRKTQGQFKCPHCDLEYNADANASINISKRFSDQWLENGAVQLSAHKMAG